MPIVALLGFGLMAIFSTIASHEKNELLAHPKTWKGEMLCPVGQDDCNNPTPTPTFTSIPKDRIIK